MSWFGFVGCASETVGGWASPIVSAQRRAGARRRPEMSNMDTIKEADALQLADKPVPRDVQRDRRQGAGEEPRILAALAGEPGCTVT